MARALEGLSLVLGKANVVVYGLAVKARRYTVVRMRFR
jgi:hypothetical protein